MIKINKNYIDRFKLYNHEYLYQMSKGIYLAFEDYSFEYIGIEMFYLADPKKTHELEDKTLNDLLQKGILEMVVEE